MKSYIIIFISYFILQIFLLLTFKNFLSEKTNISRRYLFILFVFNACINTCLFFKNLVILGTIYNFIFFFILIKYTFKLNLRQTIYYGFVVWGFALILDILIMNIMNYFPKYVFDSTITKLISTCILILLLVLLSRVKRIKKFISNMFIKINNLNFSIIKLVILIVSYIILDIVCLYNIEIENFGILIAIMSFSIVIIVIMFVSKQYAIYILKQSNKLLLKNGKESLKIINEYRILKHNITNQLIGLKTVSNKKTNILIDELIKSYNENFQSSTYLLDIPAGINGLIFEKLNCVKDKNIQWEIDNKMSDDLLEKIGAKNYNQLCEAIGVSLDNALEAVIDSVDKILYLKFYEANDYISIIIINSFTGTIDIDKLGTFSYSSKGEGHGLGIFSLFQKKNIKIKYEIKNNLFKTIIRLEKQFQEY